MRATDHEPPGHKLTDRPEQVGALVERIARLTVHILRLIGNASLSASVNAAEVQEEREALLTGAVNMLQAVQALDAEAASELEVRDLARSGAALGQ